MFSAVFGTIICDISIRERKRCLITDLLKSLFTQNKRKSTLVRQVCFSSSFLAYFGYLEFSFACDVYETRRNARDPIIRGRVDFSEFAEESTRVIKRRHARGWATWITTETGIDVNEDFLTTSARARALALLRRAASRVTRDATRCVHVHARVHCRRVICTEAQAGSGCLTACRYVSQPCCFLPPISSLTSF